MGLFKLLHKRPPPEQPTPDIRQSFVADLNPLVPPDQTLNPYNPAAFQPTRTDKDTELILSKLDAITARLENLARRLELIERYLQQPQQPPPQQPTPFPRRW